MESQNPVSNDSSNNEKDKEGERGSKFKNMGARVIVVLFLIMKKTLKKAAISGRIKK